MEGKESRADDETEKKPTHRRLRDDDSWYRAPYMSESGEISEGLNRCAGNSCDIKNPEEIELQCLVSETSESRDNGKSSQSGTIDADDDCVTSDMVSSCSVENRRRANISSDDLRSRKSHTEGNGGESGSCSKNTNETENDIDTFSENGDVCRIADAHEAQIINGMANLQIGKENLDTSEILVKEDNNDVIDKKGDKDLMSRNSSCGTRVSASNLTKSPISVIALSANSTDPSGYEETVTTIKTQDSVKERTILTREDQCRPEHNESYSQKITTDTKRQDADCEPPTHKRERPTTRRRVSTAIQRLQEKLQQEIASNEQRAYKPGRSSSKSKTNDTKGSSRQFARERSRKRSKSRMGFKVYHGARKHPPVNAKERPYRQWAGVGTCVTADCRYIVSSKTYNGKARSETQKPLTTSQTSDEMTLSVFQGGIDDSFDSIDTKKHKIDEKEVDTQSVSKKASYEAISYNTTKSDRSALVEKPTVREKRHPANIPTIDPDTNFQAETSPTKSTKDRARCIKRLSERHKRAPTPHAQSSVEVGSPTGSLGGPPFLRTAERVRSDLSSAMSSPKSTSIGSGHQAMEVQARKRQSMERRSPSLRVNGGCSPKYKFPMSSRRYKRASSSANGHGAPASIHMKPTGYSGKSSDAASAFNDSAASDHGSAGALWSDISSTTCESSIITEDGCSSVSRRRDVSDNTSAFSNNSRSKHTSGASDQFMTGLSPTGGRVSPNKAYGHVNQAKKYVDVQAIADFKGNLPGQLSFRKGQQLKQMVHSRHGAEDEMSYGYYRVGRFKRKRKGLFPSICVVPLDAIYNLKQRV